MDRTSITLLEALQKRSGPEDWNRFIKVYTPIVYRWTRKLNIPLEHAEDLIQEVFLLVHRKIPVFHYDSAKSFRAWLKSILRNQYINFTRRKQLPTTNDHDLDQFPLQLHEEYWSTEFHRDLLTQGLEGIRGEFGREVFQAFELSTLQGISIQKTAEHMGATASMVYQSRSRVLKRLRQFIGGMWE